MLYLYHKKLHIGCVISFVALVVIYLVLLITNGANLSYSVESGFFVLLTCFLVIYLFTMLLPDVAYFIFIKLISLFTKRSSQQLLSDEVIKKNFLRSRFIYLGLCDFILLLFLFELLTHLF